MLCCCFFRLLFYDFSSSTIIIIYREHIFSVLVRYIIQSFGNSLQTFFIYTLWSINHRVVWGLKRRRVVLALQDLFSAPFASFRLLLSGDETIFYFIQYTRVLFLYIPIIHFVSRPTKFSKRVLKMIITHNL